VNFVGSANAKFTSWRECLQKANFFIASVLGAQFANVICCLATMYSIILKAMMAGSIANYITIEWFMPHPKPIHLSQSKFKAQQEPRKQDQ